MGIWQKLFGSKAKESGASDKAALRQKLSPQVRGRLEQGISVTKECIAILERCHTTPEVFGGFRRCRTLLANMNHPLAEAVDATLRTEGTDMLDEAHIHGLKDHFLKSCRAFLAATGG
jgi:hypothetical protein